MTIVLFVVVAALVGAVFALAKRINVLEEEVRNLADEFSQSSNIHSYWLGLLPLSGEDRIKLLDEINRIHGVRGL